MEERIIGRFEGQKEGPLLICIGGMHGNEPAGITAIKEVLRLLENEPTVNQGFTYRGNFIGVRGNLRALERQQRYTSRDLNRMLIAKEMDLIRDKDPLTWSDEDIERFDLINTIEAEIKKYNPPLTLILDFHTTTADGGIFTIAGEDEMSRRLALGLHAPVILGISEGLEGTTIEYFNKPSANCYCIVFEAGQHTDPDCVHRSVAAIINCMRSIGAVDPEDVDHRHDGLLISQSAGLPPLTRLVYHYRIKEGENFRMKQGYQNFQAIQKGEELAFNQEGSILSPFDGMILMPKYQSQGEDGFFIIQPVDN